MKLLIFSCLIGVVLGGAQNAASRLQKMEQMLNDLTEQLMNQQLFVEERIRSDGDSGIKQVRRMTSGTKTYHSETTSAIHSHPTYKDVIGFGEVAAVLNGVEFRTRHNDYALKMPSKTSRNYHAVDPISYPPVPPSVTAKHTVAEQVAEMKEYFKAFRQQNTTIRNYIPYFKPAICYLEGAWEKDTRHFREPYHSETHKLNAESWQELVEKVKISSYTGQSDAHEDIAFLPTTLIRSHNGNAQQAQWNYRILCNPLHGDVPLKVFKPIDNLAYRMTRKFNMSMYSGTEEARFTLASDEDKATYDASEGYGIFDDREYARGVIDDLMAQVPGVNNYKGSQHDNEFHMPALDVNIGRNKIQNTAFYHREYKLNHGPQTVHRGFADTGLFVAQNHQSHFIAAPELKECKTVNHLQVNCTIFREYFTYAFPLEVIYLNPLHTWNPYNLQTKADDSEVTKNGRSGDLHNSKMAYDGISSSHFYQTPSEFFGNNAGNDVGVTDSHGTIHRVTASGIQTLLPNIPGVGTVRQRWPIYPIHSDGDSIGKETSALVDLVNHMSSMSPYYQEPPVPAAKNTKQPDLLFKLVVTHNDPPGSHDHEFYIPAADWEAMEKNGETVQVLTTLESGHTHLLQIQVDKHTHKPKISKCDDRTNSCWDGHRDFYRVTNIVY